MKLLNLVTSWTPKRRWVVALRAMLKNVIRVTVSASSIPLESSTDARAFATTLVQPQSGFLGGRHVNNYTKNQCENTILSFFLCRFYWPLALRTATSKAKNDHWSNGNRLGRIWYALFFEPEHDF